ncbi:Dynein regulatory complex protein 1, C-terminal [Cinara cedri]|uniref:Dynein regulatory complex protein 1, C-terminal n=1 Tax=Cinara cedri TaxID=506608 RepID=A0A5E4MXG4_9HEMI|nr:Dynein regulatory complex protein 1, C-terminal [Cinara cedri]
MKKESQAKFVLKNNCSVGLLLNQDKTESRNKQHERTDIQKRADIKNKLNENQMNEKELDKMDTPIPVMRQIENSEQELISYTEEGSQLVTNVQLANDNRENNRRYTDKIERDLRLKAVEHEAEIANAKFTEISCQWPIILKKNDALNIHEHIELQRKRGHDLIEQKNKMIELLKSDLAESDSRFLQEQAAQSEDIRILQQRIENQVKFIRKQYKNHIQYIKSTMDQEREQRIDKSNENWAALYNETMSIESTSLDDRLAMIEKKENNIMKQYEMNEEIIRNLKSNVNTELHDIQREFELIKMKCIENVEKLNYNYQVLKRREEENAYAKAAQRRKINKLQDILSTKRKIFRETKTVFNAKVPLLQDEINKLNQDVERHEKKAQRFAEIQEKTYKELWDFSQEQIASHLERIFEIDRIIHETQLGVGWQRPQKLKYLDISDLPSYRRKPSVAPGAESNLCVDLRVQNQRNAMDLQYTETRERALLQLVFDMTMKNVSSFILDNELIEIIIKTHGEKSLTLFYNTMAACGLNTTDSWKCLLSYVQSMVTCADCRGPVMWHKPDFDHRAKADREWKTELIDDILTFGENHTKRVERILSTTAKVLEKTDSNNYITFLKQKPTPLLQDVDNVLDARDYQSFEHANTDSDNNSTITFSLSLTDFEQLCSENDSNPAIKSQQSLSQVELEHFQMESEERHDFIDAASMKINEENLAADIRSCDDPSHPITINDMDYLRVIKKSIDISKSKSFDQRNKTDSEYYLTKMLNLEDIRDYWNQFLYAFPEDRLKVWDIFDKAIKKYYETLHRFNVLYFWILSAARSVLVSTNPVPDIAPVKKRRVRFKKIKEVEKLETENMELKNILKQFMDAEQDDARLQTICTPKIKKQQRNPIKRNSKPVIFTDISTNICGTSMRILKLDRPEKKKINRPFTAPTK